MLLSESIAITGFNIISIALVKATKKDSTNRFEPKFSYKIKI